MSRELDRVIARYVKAQDEARRQAALNIVAAFGRDFHASHWSRRAADTYNREWLPVREQRLRTNGGWDWDEIVKRGDFKCLDLTMWRDERLCGVSVISVSNNAVRIEAVEGSPSPDCPLKGIRAAVAIETAACYAQNLGRDEIRLIPANDRLAQFYAEVFNFERVDPKKGVQPYFRRRL